MDNMAHIMQDILKGKDIRELTRLGGSSIVIGAGPSLKEFEHLKMLAESNYKGTIIATDRILIPCLKAGVIPDFVCSVDADPEQIAQMYNHKLVFKYRRRMKAIFSTTVHPSVLSMWKGDRYFFLPTFDSLDKVDGITRALHYMTKSTIIPGTGDVGGFCWHISHGLDTNPIALIGMDYGDPVMENLPDYRMYVEKGGVTKPEELKKNFHRHYNPYWKNYRYSGLLFETCWDTFKDRIRIGKKHGRKTINCTGAGLIYDQKAVECMNFEDFLKRWKK